MTPPKQKIKQLGISKSQSKIQTQRAKLGASRANEVKIFKEKFLPTSALDTTYERVGSISPLKFRPTIDLEGKPEPMDRSYSNAKERSQSKSIDRSQSKKKERHSVQTLDFTKKNVNRGSVQTINFMKNSASNG